MKKFKRSILGLICGGALLSCFTTSLASEERQSPSNYSPCEEKEIADFSIRFGGSLPFGDRRHDHFRERDRGHWRGHPGYYRRGYYYYYPEYYYNHPTPYYYDPYYYYYDEPGIEFNWEMR